MEAVWTYLVNNPDVQQHILRFGIVTIAVCWGRQLHRDLSRIAANKQ